MRFLKTTLIAFLLLILHNYGFSQRESSFSETNLNLIHLDKSVDIPLVAFGSALWALGMHADQKAQALSLAQIQGLIPPQQGLIYRGVLRNWSPTAARLSDIGMLTAFGTVPIIALADRNYRRQLPELIFLGLEALLITDGITRATKALVLRPRPYMYNPLAPLDKKLEKDGRFSFISGHASFTSMTAFFSASLLNRRFEGKPRIQALCWTGAGLISLGVGSLRVIAGKHYVTDVAAGLGVGTLIGILIPHLHILKSRSKKSCFRNLKVGPSPGGVNLSLQF